MNNKTKDKFRRVIRGIMIVLAVALLVLGLAVPIANNAVAMGVARELEAIELPADTSIIEKISLAGRLTNEIGSVQYFGALLIKSEHSIEELRAHYAQYNTDRILSYRVEPQRGQKITVLGDIDLAFREDVGKEGYYIVYNIRTGGNAVQWWLDMDVRG